MSQSITINNSFKIISNHLCPFILLVNNVLFKLLVFCVQKKFNRTQMKLKKKNNSLVFTKDVYVESNQLQSISSTFHVIIS